MAESIQLADPLFKLVLRFGNGEVIHYVMNDPIDARMITPETRYAVVSSFSCQNPAECTEVAIINMRDVTFIKTEMVTLDQLSVERRMAGMRNVSGSSPEDKLPKTLSQLRFV